jgi:VWFA-related protein
VTDHGQPIRGLVKDDFLVREDQVEVPVAIFEEIESAPAAATLSSLPPRTARNYAAGNAQQDVVILLLDYLNGSWSSRARIRAFMVRIARQLEASRTAATVLVLTPNGSLVQLLSFTSDIRNLEKVLGGMHDDVLPENLRDGVSLPTSSAIDVLTEHDMRTSVYDFWANSTMRPSLAKDRARWTAVAFEQIAESYRGLPGRKKLLWLSTGFPNLNLVEEAGSEHSTQQMSGNEGAILDLYDSQKRAWVALSSSNIAVYPIDANGVRLPADMAKFNAEYESGTAFNVSDLPTNTSSLLMVASKTGGTVCVNILSDCVKQAVADAPHYYLLGFYLRGNEGSGWHNLNVKVRRLGMRVRARRGFLVMDHAGQPVTADSDQFLVAMESPLDYTSVPMQLAWNMQAMSGGQRNVDIVIDSPSGGVTPRDKTGEVDVDILGVARPVGSKTGLSFSAKQHSKLDATELRKLTAGGFRFKTEVSLNPGRYAVRVFLRDNVSGKVGTVSTLVDVPK